MSPFYLLVFFAVPCVVFKLNKTYKYDLRNIIRIYLTKDTKIRNGLIHQSFKNHDYKKKISNTVKIKYHEFMTNWYKKKL